VACRASVGNRKHLPLLAHPMQALQLLQCCYPHTTLQNEHPHTTLQNEHGNDTRFGTGESNYRTNINKSMCKVYQECPEKSGGRVSSQTPLDLGALMCVGLHKAAANSRGCIPGGVCHGVVGAAKPRRRRSALQAG